MRKKSFKKILAFIIVLMMIVPMIPAIPVSAAISSPANGDTFEIGDVVTLNQSAATGGQSNQRRYQYIITGPASYSRTITSTNNTTTQSWDTTGLAAGQYTITAQASTNSGSTWANTSGTASVTVTLVVASPPPVLKPVPVVDEAPGAVESGAVSQYYGETTWTDYTIETSVSNLVQTVADKNFKVFFRVNSGNMYQLIITPGGWIGLQSSNGWTNLKDYGGPATNTSAIVNYKIEVIGNNVKVYVNDIERINYKETNTNLKTGRIQWVMDAGISGTVHSFKIALMMPDEGGGDDDAYVIYEEEGPLSLPVVFGDDTWTDYEFEFDVTPISGNNMRVAFRGGSYYSWWSVGNDDWPFAWVGVQSTGLVSGEPGFWPDQPAVPFIIGQTVRVQYKVVGTSITLSFKKPGDENFTENWVVDMSPNGTKLNGGVILTSEGLNATISNIIARDLSGTLKPPEPPEPPEPPVTGNVKVDVNPGATGNLVEKWYGETTWKDYIIETSISDMVNIGTQYGTGNYLMRFRAGEQGKWYYMQSGPNGALVLTDSITFGEPSSHIRVDYAGPSPSTSAVKYTIAVVGNNIKVYINDGANPVINFTDDYTKTTANPWYTAETFPRSIFASGRVGWMTEGVTCNINSYKVTLLDKESEDPNKPTFTQDGPFDLPYIVGDATWKDYEIEFDFTYTVSGGIRIGLRGGAYYSFLEGTGARNIGLANVSGAGTAFNPGTTFTLNQPTHFRYKIQGDVISLWTKNPGAANEVKIFEVNVRTTASWPAPTLTGGVIIQSDSWGGAGDGKISNVVVRDLAGTIVPPKPPDPPPFEGVVVVDEKGPIQLANRDPLWYGEFTWKNYILEADISNLQKDAVENYQWWNFQFRLRGNSTGQYYYTYINSAQVQLKDSITWDPTWVSGNASTSPTTGKVSYKFEVIDNVVTCYANGTKIFTYKNDTDPRIKDLLDKGRVGLCNEGATCTVENIKITLLDEPSGGDPGDPGLTTGSIPIRSPKLPVAGIYPISAYIYRPNNASWNYTETIVWSPAIQNTFLPNTAYKATVTLTRVTGTSNMFTGKTAADLGLVPLNAIQYATVTTANATTMVIEFNFPATGSTLAKFEEGKNMLFFDDFNGTALDLKKWQNPLLYQQDRQGNSKWEAKNVFVNDGKLRLRYAKENAANNFISASAVRTRDIFDNAYGYYEAKIKYPAIDQSHSGAWGAFWLMYYGSDATSKTGTEIDIVEFAGVHANGVQYNWASGGLHWDGYGSNHKSTTSMVYNAKTGPTIYDGKFHIYSFEWSPTEYKIYVDGILAGRNTKTDMQKVNGDICENPLYIKFSIESSAPTTGTNWNMGWGGPVPAGIWEDYMEVDYVAVYDRPKTAEVPVYITDYVNVTTNIVYDGAQPQVKATVKNINQFVQGDFSGTISLDTPAGIILGETSKTYENLAYNQTAVLYFDINPNFQSTKASEIIKFNYTVDGIAPVGSAQVTFGVLEAAKAVEDNIFANSSVIDFAKGMSGGVSASLLNSADLSAIGKLAWDDTYLYANIVVTDNVHYQNYTAGNRWQDDGVQISVGNAATANWREMEFVLASNKTTIYQHCYSNNTGAAGATGAVNQSATTMQSEIVRDDDAKTTTYNIKIAWAYVGITNPTAGDVAKIAITINDNDGSGRKDLAYFDGISTGTKGQGMGYVVLLPEIPKIIEYTVSFDLDGDITDVTVIAGETVEKPADPVKNWYKFIGWYLEDVLFDFDTSITGDITLVAVWEWNSYWVVFDADNGGDTWGVLVEHGETVEPPAPIYVVKEGYTFLGWFLDGELFDFDTEITEDITLVAGWEIIKYNVTFDANNGDEPVAVTVNYGETVTEPEDPIKYGYTFLGWFLDGELFDFDTEIFADITLTAGWKKIVVPPVNQITVNGAEVKFEVINGVATIAITDKAIMNQILSGNTIVFDLSSFDAVDIKVPAEWFKDVDKTITIVTAKGTDTVKTKTLWNNSGKDRLITVRKGKIDIKNI